MREIKFRIYANTDDGMKMVYLDKLECDNGLWFSSQEHVDEYEKSIMQYAGMTDKNGTDVYEDDVVKTIYGIGRIINELGCFLIEWIDDKEAMMELLAYEPDKYRYGRLREEFEVIGNIHEKPELLNHNIFTS